MLVKVNENDVIGAKSVELKPVTPVVEVTV